MDGPGSHYPSVFSVTTLLNTSHYFQPPCTVLMSSPWSRRTIRKIRRAVLLNWSTTRGGSAKQLEVWPWQSWDHACRRFTVGPREGGWGSQYRQSPSCVFFEAAGIGQSWERATAGHKPDLISYPLKAPRNEKNQRQAGKSNPCYVWPLINSTFSATLLWTRLKTSGFTTTTRRMALQSAKTAWTKKKCGRKRRGFWHIRPAFLTDSKRRRSTAAASSSALNFPTTEQGIFATSRTCGCLWRSTREQLSGARSTLLALRRSVWTAGCRLKHLARLQLRMTGSLSPTQIY